MLAITRPKVRHVCESLRSTRTTANTSPCPAAEAAGNIGGAGGGSATRDKGADELLAARLQRCRHGGHRRRRTVQDPNGRKPDEGAERVGVRAPDNGSDRRRFNETYAVISPKVVSEVRLGP
jgi:hypothetical protein